jgi:hypothetical protein
MLRQQTEALLHAGKIQVVLGFKIVINNPFGKPSALLTVLIELARSPAGKFGQALSRIRRWGCWFFSSRFITRVIPSKSVAQ